MNPASATPWLPQPLRVLAGRALEVALNHCLSLDPDSQHRIEMLHGRSVQLHLRGPELALAIRVDRQRLEVGPVEGAGQLRVTASPGGLLAMLLRRDGDAMAPGKVEIAGDAELARRLQQLAGQFAPDFEEAFARTFGDVLGVPIARAASRALRRARGSAAHFREDSADWLRDEAKLGMAPGEVDDFLDGVDHLRERSDRFEARLARLERQHKRNQA